MFRRLNRLATGVLKSNSCRRPRASRGLRSLQFERLENRVVFASVVSIPSQVELAEGASYSVPITRSGDVSQPLTLKYEFKPLTTEPADFSRTRSNSGTVTLNPGVKTFRLSAVTAVDDKIDEYDESFYLSLQWAAGAKATIANSTTFFTIKDNDAAPKVSIRALANSKSENDGGASFEVTLDAPSEKTIAIDFMGDSWRTFQWGQDAYFSDDPNASTGRLTFNARETRKEIAIGIRDDGIVEPDEFARVALTAGHNVSGFENIDATVMIRDNDIPTVEIDDATPVHEGDSAGAAASFNVRVREPLERDVKVKYWTGAGSAKSSTDYVSTKGELTFQGSMSGGSGQSQQTVRVPIRADAVAESTETFYLGVGPVSSASPDRLVVPRTYGKATILDDDAQTQVGTPAPISAIPTPENGFGVVRYRWAAAANAARYEIWVGKVNSNSGTLYTRDSEFGFSNPPIANTTFSPLFLRGLSEGVYTWKVRAIAADETVGAWSDSQQFVMPQQYASSW